jgi:hypothetical protein
MKTIGYSFLVIQYFNAALLQGTSMYYMQLSATSVFSHVDQITTRPSIPLAMISLVLQIKPRQKKYENAYC